MSPISQIVARNRNSELVGIASWCTAHPETLRAILHAHRESSDAILIEATCNQVNQHGGYTGMTPPGFRRFIETLARECGIDAARIILGGDHLGPNPWRALPAAAAMAEAKILVREYAEAGFSKLHLDASMACADDGVLAETQMAERAAELCAVAEASCGAAKPCYVIGTEVPIPGGETETLDGLAVTTADAAENTFALHREAFARCGVSHAFDRVIGIVVQPGVDFGNSQIFAYNRQRAARLSQSIAGLPGVVFEAHSTDYQTAGGLRDLVESHFAILKVGPELTFAFREAIIAMAGIEDWLNVALPSRILETIDEVLDHDPSHWRSYAADGVDRDMIRVFGLSDRIRYYWPDPRLVAAVAELRNNIDRAIVPPGLVSQFAGQLQFSGGGSLSEHIIQSRVGAVVAKYRSACGLS